MHLSYNFQPYWRYDKTFYPHISFLESEVEKFRAFLNLAPHVHQTSF